MKHKRRMKKIIFLVIGSLLISGYHGEETTAATVTPPGVEPSATPSATPSAAPSPTLEPTAEPTATPTPTIKPTETPQKEQTGYRLLNEGVKYQKGGQKGISYRKVKGKKVYQLESYTTDTVTLVMSEPSTFEIYGGKNKKEVKEKKVVVSAKGVVKCKKTQPGQTLQTVVKATSKSTGSVQYIYINFRECLTASVKKVTVCERRSQTVRFNYAYKKLQFSFSNEKKATINKKGKITGVKKGTTTLLIKVKDSEKNQVKIRITVKKEPWIVSSKNPCYDYEDLTRDCHKLTKRYSGKIHLSTLGTTYDNRQIWCLRVGSESATRRLVINAAIHAREWKNTQVLMRQTEELMRSYSDYQDRLKDTCVYIIPMDNPDGVTISQYGYKKISDKKFRKRVKKLKHNEEWKANARGVNLNDNFPAGFRKGKHRKPDYMRYSGKKAGSEKETKALMAFINQVNPQAVMNLHSTGSIVYWDFNVEDKLHKQLEAMANKVHSFTKYTLMPKSSSTDAAGGFADWLVYKKGIVSVTVETGTSVCPLPHSEYKTIRKKNKKLLMWFMTEYKKD